MVATRSFATSTALLLALAALTLAGCDSGSPLVQPAVGTIQIRTSPDAIAAPWTLNVPGGTTRTGNGDATLAAMPSGGYTITFGAVEAWVLPSPDTRGGHLDAGGTLVLTGDYAKLEIHTGTIVIDPNPDSISVPWSLSGPAGATRAGVGDARLEEMVAGPYTITWGTVDGYVTPSAQTATLAENREITFSQTYYLRETPRGSVVVDVQPDGIDAGWLVWIQGGDYYYGSGDSTLADIPAAVYQVAWGAVDGFSSPTPNPASITVVADGSVTVTGVYSEIVNATGTVVVDTEPNALNASWTLSGPDGFLLQGQGDRTLTGRAVGAYQLQWNAVTDYDTPASQNATLSDGGTITLSGTYTLQTGTLVIDAQPDALNAPWSLSGPTGTTSGNGDRTISGTRVGTYTLTWGAVNGWNSPSPSTRVVALDARQTVQLLGVYSEIPPAVGTVVVDPRPGTVNASWRLVGPNGFDEFGGPGGATFEDLPAGTYSITWNEVANWRTPVPAQASQTLDPGETISFVGVYGQLDAPAIQPVSGAVRNGASLTLNGSGFGAHDLDISNGVGPNGWIEQNANGTIFDNLSSAPGWDTGMSSAQSFITTERAYSGSKAALARVDNSIGNNWQASMRYEHAQAFDKIYATFWIYWDPIDLTPHRSTQWKSWRINHNGIVSDQAGQLLFSSHHNATGAIYDYQWVAHCALDCSGARWDHCYMEALPIPYYSARFNDPYQYRFLNKGDRLPWTDAHPQPRQWNRIEIYVERGQVDTFTGSLLYTIQRPGQGKVFEEFITQLKLWRSETTCRNPQDPWRFFQMQNYWDDDGSNGAPLFTTDRSDFFYDDIYLQFGTQARVELGDSPIYEECTRLEIQTPTSWRDGSITLQVNQGRFTSGSTVYLFVVRGDGSVSAGAPVVLQ